MRRHILVLISGLCLAVTAVAQDSPSCTDYNYQDTPYFWTPTGTQDHVAGGYHIFYSTLTGNCTYASVGQPNCSSTSQSYGSISNQDTGRLTTVNPLYQHNLGNSVNSGISQAPLGGATTTSQATTAFPSPTNCILFRNWVYFPLA